MIIDGLCVLLFCVFRIKYKMYLNLGAYIQNRTLCMCRSARTVSYTCTDESERAKERKIQNKTTGPTTVSSIKVQTPILICWYAMHMAITIIKADVRGFNSCVSHVSCVRVCVCEPSHATFSPVRCRCRRSLARSPAIVAAVTLFIVIVVAT